MFGLPLDANIIDAGAGDSYLVDVLIEKGYSNIYVLDISENALERAKQRLWDRTKHVHWIVSDVLDFVTPIQFDFWHDRAAFHFLTSEAKVNKYVSLAEGAIKQDGFLVLGTFSENGPEKWSGLQIKQYNETSMSTRFEKGFDRIKCVHEEHETPFNTKQNFLFCSFKKK